MFGECRRRKRRQGSGVLSSESINIFFLFLPFCAHSLRNGIAETWISLSSEAYGFNNLSPGGFWFFCFLFLCFRHSKSIRRANPSSPLLLSFWRNNIPEHFFLHRHSYGVEAWLSHPSTALLIIDYARGPVCGAGRKYAGTNDRRLIRDGRGEARVLLHQRYINMTCRIINMKLVSGKIWIIES